MVRDRSTNLGVLTPEPAAIACADAAAPMQSAWWLVPFAGACRWSGGCGGVLTEVGGFPDGLFERRNQTDHRPVLNMCKADAVEVRLSVGERSATRFANSTSRPTLSSTIRRSRSSCVTDRRARAQPTHHTDDDTLKRTIDAVQALARRKPDNPELMPL